MRDIERRTLSAQVELRATDSGPGQLVGYAAKYGTISRNLGYFVETVKPGAFDKTLADGGRVMARFNHDSNMLLGTTDAKTLDLESDGIGLRYTVTLPDTSAGRDAAALAERGDLRFSSFAFRTLDESWGETDTGYALRTLLEVALVDVAPVADPAYLDTSVAKRHFAEHIGMTPADLDKKTPEEIRAIISGETAPEPVDNHSGTSVSIRRLQLALSALD